MSAQAGLLSRAFELWSRLRGRALAALAPEVAAAERAVAIHRAYWRPSPAERAALEEKDELSFGETLRLFHLVCVDLVEERRAAGPIATQTPDRHDPDDPRSGSAHGHGDDEAPRPDEPGRAHDHDHEHERQHAHLHEHDAHHRDRDHAHAHDHGHGHDHDHGHDQDHDHDHEHGDHDHRRERNPAAAGAAGAAGAARPALDLAPPGDGLVLARELAERLLEDKSPYAPRRLTLWRRGGGPLPRAADLEGRYRNASIAHLGALEVLRLDARGLPCEVGFVGFGELAGIELGEPALYRPACLHYEAPRERPDPGTPAAVASEVVLLPTRYAIDPAGLGLAIDRRSGEDGLRLVACLDDAAPPRGIGVGRQALIEERAPAEPARAAAAPSPAPVFLDDLDGLLVTVDLDDPRFEVKCRARGVDPRDVREALVFGKKPKGDDQGATAKR